MTWRATCSRAVSRSLFRRCGATEMRTVADWLQNGGHNFTDRTRADIRNLSGVFPTDDATLDILAVSTSDCAEPELPPLERRGRAGGHPRL